MTDVAAGQISHTAQRDAQKRWASMPVGRRLTVVRKVRQRIAGDARFLASCLDRDPAQSLTAEVLPLLEACRFLEDQAESILAPRRPDGSAPPWLGGTDLEIRREPLGVVLVIGPANYPLFLPAVHALQALVAGNAVILKPGHGGAPVLTEFVKHLSAAGLDPDLVRLPGESPAEARSAIEAGVDKVVLTGSYETGRTVLAQLADSATPSVMELSGDDPVFVRPGADLERVEKAIQFGLALNGGQTCIAPKRVYAWPQVESDVRTRLAGLPVPVVLVHSDEEALELSARSGYALGATVFGKTEDCIRFAGAVRAGVVVVNDMIVPTADPRLPFGGRGKSGFGVTRGAEGLLEMTTVKAVVVRHGRWLPHLDAPHPVDAELFASYIGWRHGGTLAGRLRALFGLVGTAMRRR